jgi:hypothetical protein
MESKVEEEPFLVWFEDTEPGESKKAMTEFGLKCYHKKYKLQYYANPENRKVYNLNKSKYWFSHPEYRERMNQRKRDKRKEQKELKEKLT